MSLKHGSRITYLNVCGSYCTIQSHILKRGTTKTVTETQMGAGSGYSFAPSGKRGRNVRSVIVEVGWG